MIRSFKANAICRVFANRKDRVVIKAKTNDCHPLHATCAHALYTLCECLRGLLTASTQTAAWQPLTSMRPSGAWMRGMSPRVVVWRVSPVVVVA
ncbi:MAG: hypothetical protein IT427_03570 [Pirellulales bacterium]|nr:hypothetical protein [Pirellulales bacterium]